MATSDTWNDPDRCPFCGDQIPSPGAGFVDHLGESPDCESDFGDWRARITDDIRGGWAG
jgi:hypothetical protein